MMSCPPGNASAPGCDKSENPFASELFPSIVQCFSIILLGYLSARFGLLTSANANGIGKYITTFALPAVFFQAMVTIDFGGVNWLFLGAICLGKAIMFLVTVVIALFISRPISLSLAGILAIFTSQSNDVALGYPILLSLLPGQAHYVYLVAPIQLAVLNPIGFTLCEVQSHLDARRHPGRLEEARERGRCTDSVAWRIFKGVFGNPLVFMTLIGVPVNFILKRQIPEIINKALTVVAQSFAGTALFVLGFNMLGKMGNLQRRTIYLLAVLLLAKLVVSPFLMYQLVEALNPREGNSTLQYRLFAFLYGGIPTAPPVFLFASQYHVAVDVVASGLVLGTFISFPWTYISARLVTLAVMRESDYSSVIRSTAFNASILSIVSVVWVSVIFVLSRRYRRLPHMFTSAYLFSIFLSCTGNIGSQLVHDETREDTKRAPWVAYLPFTVFFIGVVGTRVWTLIIGLALAFLKTRGLCFVLFHKWIFFLAGFGTPVLVAGVLLMFAGRRPEDIDSAFQFGNSQLIVSLVVLIGSLLGTVVCLALIVRQPHDDSDPDVSETPVSPPEHSINNSITDNNSFSRNYGREAGVKGDMELALETLFHRAVTMEATSTAEPAALAQEEGSTERVGTAIVGVSPFEHDETQLVEEEGVDQALEEWLNARRCTLPQHNVDAEQQRICQRNLINYRKSTRSFLQEAGETGLGDVDAEYQTHQHIILFILAIISMFMGILLCIWRLVNEKLSGVYLMLEFLDSIFNFGQGFFAFALFGLDTDLIILPCKKRFRKLIYGVEEIHLPPEENLDADIILTRQQFVKYHLNKCRRELVGSRRYHLTVYQDVFRGDHFVAWLKRVGLATDDIDALAYGQKLLYGRVFHHVQREHHLHNLPYFYRFSHEFDDLQASQEEPTQPLVDIDNEADGFVQPRQRPVPNREQ